MLNWWRTASRLAKTVTIVFGAFAAVFGAVTAAHSAWPFIDPWLLAHRGYVVTHVGGVQTSVNELLIWKNEDAKDRTLSEIGQLDVMLQKEQDPQVRAILKQNLERSKQKANEYDARIRSLKSQ